MWVSPSELKLQGFRSYLMAMGKFIGIGAALAASVIVAGMANADTTPLQAVSYGPGLNPETNPIQNYDMAFNQFNASLGTLTGVTITFSDNSSGTVKVTNGSSASSPYTMGLDESLSLTDPNSNVVASYLDSSSTQQATIGAGDSQTITANASGTSTPVTFTSDLSEFIGSGTINLLLNGKGVAFVSGASPFIASTDSQSFGTVSIVYDYAVPAPASGLLLFFGGLAVVGGLTLRRRAIR